MRDIKTIVKEYQEGNFEKRLNLFLECPPLRNEFMQIENGDDSSPGARVSEPVIHQSRKRKSAFYPCTHLLKWCNSLVD